MGFLKFLKKGEEKGRGTPLGELSIPPSQKISPELPDFQSQTDRGKQDLPEIKPFDFSNYEAKQLPNLEPDMAMFNFPAPPVQVPSPPAIPPMPEFPKRDTTPNQILSNPFPPPPKPAFPETKSPFTKPVILQKFQETTKDTDSTREKPVGEVFLDAQKYRSMLEDIDELTAHTIHKADIKTRTARDTEAAKLSDCLEDMQRQLMFIEKNLFEV